MAEILLTLWAAQGLNANKQVNLVIEIRGLTKKYKMGDSVVNALNGVSLQIKDGEFVAIMGPSGSGKSTLTHILGLLDVPNSGSYLLNGQEVSRLSEDELSVLRRETVGFVFQQFNLLPRLSARQNVALPLLYSKGRMDLEAADELLDRVGLGPRRDHRPNELSGGQQQRVAIARALINKPRIILADEPTGNLDSNSEKEIMELLKELNSQGMTVVIVTHEEEIGHQAKRLIRMRDGGIFSDEQVSHDKDRSFMKRSKVDRLDSTGEKSNAADSPLTTSEFFEYFRQGLQTLMANKVRAALSMLGILIGVAAVIAMLALGRGAQKAIEAQLASLGSNLLVLRPGSVRVQGVRQESGSVTRLTIDDARELQEAISGIRDLAPRVNGRGQVTYLDRNWNTQIYGVTPSYANLRASVPTYGRFFSDEENTKRLRLAVIGMTLVRELFPDRSPIGEYIKVDKVMFQVIGILPEKGSNGWQDQDDVIVIPLATAMYRLLGKTYVDSFDIEVDPNHNMDDLSARIHAFMIHRKHVPEHLAKDAYEVRNMADIREAMSESSRTMSTLLASIAAISLVVGGIGIMNIMLVSVTERTKEVGLRKAIGGRRRDILFQFLSESVVVSVVGGLAGIALGLLITSILSAVAGWTTSISWIASIGAFFFSGMVGVLFGIYPAQKAARLHPIDALRYE